MNWRRLIYSIVIPVFASIPFGILISIGKVSNLSVFLYAVAMLVAAVLSSTGKGKNGDALSTLLFGGLVLLTAFLLAEILGDIRTKFSWFFVLKTVGFMAAAASTVWLAKAIMKTKPQNSNQNNNH